MPRLASLVVLFGQFVETPCFFLNVKGHCHGSFFERFWISLLITTLFRQQIAILLSPPSPFDRSRCFNIGTKGADAAADLLEVLRNSPLEKLNFGFCDQIPSTAWQKLRGASWSNLREANFSWCLVLQTWLRCLASSLRRRVFLSRMLRAIVTAVSLTTLKGQKCEIVSWKWSDMQKSLARGTATDCRQFILTVPF